MSASRGRPSIYQPLLDDLRNDGIPYIWTTVRYNHKNRTVVSQLRKRYPAFDFRAVPSGDGDWSIQAAWRGDVPTQGTE